MLLLRQRSKGNPRLYCLVSWIVTRGNIVLFSAGAAVHVEGVNTPVITAPNPPHVNSTCGRRRPDNLVPSTDIGSAQPSRRACGKRPRSAAETQAYVSASHRDWRCPRISDPFLLELHRADVAQRRMQTRMIVKAQPVDYLVHRLPTRCKSAGQGCVLA
jgi:hypothetical protein